MEEAVPSVREGHRHDRPARPRTRQTLAAPHRPGAAPPAHPRQSPPPSPEGPGGGAREHRSAPPSSEPLGGGTLQTEFSLSGDDGPADLSTLGPFCSLIGHRGAHPADVVLAPRTAAGEMAFSDGKPGCVFDHHVQTAVCDSRAKYRESRRPRAVKVESLRFPSFPGHGQPPESVTGMLPEPPL